MRLSVRHWVGTTLSQNAASNSTHVKYLHPCGRLRQIRDRHSSFEYRRSQRIARGRYELDESLSRSTRLHCVWPSGRDSEGLHLGALIMSFFDVMESIDRVSKDRGPRVSIRG